MTRTEQQAEYVAVGLWMDRYGTVHEIPKLRDGVVMGLAQRYQRWSSGNTSSHTMCAQMATVFQDECARRGLPTQWSSHQRIRDLPNGPCAVKSCHRVALVIVGRLAYCGVHRRLADHFRMAVTKRKEASDGPLLERETVRRGREAQAREAFRRNKQGHGRK